VLFRSYFAFNRDRAKIKLGSNIFFGLAANENVGAWDVYKC
jgi:hypothetical protein